MKYQIELTEYDVDFFKFCIYGMKEYQKVNLAGLESSVRCTDEPGREVEHKEYLDLLEQCQNILKTCDEWFERLDEVKK